MKKHFGCRLKLVHCGKVELIVEVIVQMPSGLTIWRIVAGLMAFWLVVLLLMSSSLYQSATNTDESLERQLFDAMKNLNDLRTENLALRKEAEELR